MTLKGEIDRLLVHGLLHLAGYDHEISPAEEKKMREAEDSILSEISRTRRSHPKTRA